jgi:CcmD family protein
MIAANQTFIIAAYAVTWLVIAGYLLYLVRGERRTRAGLARVASEPITESRR